MKEEARIMAKGIAKEAHALATPIDFEKLVGDGVLKRHGKSYYTDNLHSLPEHVAKKIKSIAQTKKGIKLSFYKETKSIKKLAEKTKKWRA
jgi:hypothetical protein